MNNFEINKVFSKKLRLLNPVNKTNMFDLFIATTSSLIMKGAQN